MGSVHEAVITYVPETEAETSIIPVFKSISSPSAGLEAFAGVAAKESGLYRSANISYSYSTSDCVNSCAKILIGPNSPVNFPKPSTTP